MAHTHSLFCGCSWVTKYIESDQFNLEPNDKIKFWLGNLSETPDTPFGTQLGMNSEGSNSQYTTAFEHPEHGFPHHATVDVPMVGHHTFDFLSAAEVNFPTTVSESGNGMSSSIAVVGSIPSSSKRTSSPLMARNPRPNCVFAVDYEKKNAFRQLSREGEKTPEMPPARSSRQHHSTCGCSPRSVARKNREIVRLEGILQHASSWGDLESPSDKAYDFDCPELLPRKPKHRTRMPVKSCLKRVAPVRFCDDLYSGESDSDCSSLSSDDDSDTDSICYSFDGDNASRTGRLLKFAGKKKEVKHVHFGKAHCLRTDQSMPSTPRTPQNDSRMERSRARQAVENKYHEMLAHKDDHAAKMQQFPSLAFTRQDAQVEQRLQRAIDITRANERAAIGRGALDFFIFVCRDRNSTGNQISEHLVDRLVNHRGNLSIVASYHGEERQYANPGTSNVSPVPAYLYRDCQSSMSWVRMMDEMDTSW
ncbi:hypothetical protein N0V84_010132 [Fusarium piperis]|uniref:Uncharacterized protein n=1 Tax=Fusarium piperis TaxID=1435070 RepID=A0A9W8W514_9HYPO|nr:hypothetical protein N0V84_010132 [Fusarium piperis]